MTPAWTLAIVAAMTGATMTDAALASPEAPVARYAPKGHPSVSRTIQQLDGTEYLYVGARQEVRGHSAGAGATLMQADPALGLADFHSVAEIAVESTAGQQIVELGWTVDLAVNGDLQPHVFVYHWVDGQQTCYNGCGWVQVSNNVTAGMRIVPGEAHRYEIKLIKNDWWLFYDGEAMGYFPQALFHDAFKQAALVQWFGEVAAGSTAPCTQMGNGKLGSDAAATGYDDLHLFDPDGTTAPASALAGALTDPTLYDAGRMTATSFGFGGPGATTGCCTPSTCQATQTECGSNADPVCSGHTLICGTCDGCTADHKCPSGVGPRDIGEQFDSPLPDRASGGCCDAGASGPSALGLGALVALVARRRRRR
jgi:MYXO-CTERM domain-containing protein